MQPHNRFLPLNRFQKGQVFPVVHEEVFGEDGGFIETICKAVAGGLSVGGVGAPAAGIHPLGAVSGGVDMDGDDTDIVGAKLGAAFVDTAHALRERDVVFFGDEEFGVVAAVLEVEGDEDGNLPIAKVFTEATVRRTLARGVEAVAVVKKDFHCLAD